MILPKVPYLPPWFICISQFPQNKPQKISPPQTADIILSLPQHLSTLFKLNPPSPLFSRPHSFPLFFLHHKYPRHQPGQELASL